MSFSVSNSEAAMICRYCNKNVESYRNHEWVTTTFDNAHGYNDTLRICGCMGIDPLNTDPDAKRNWVVYGSDGGVVDVNPYSESMIQRSAEFSEDQQYRFKLSRIWEPTGLKILFIMLNPSTANAAVDDRTIKELTRITSKVWTSHTKYGGFYVGNLYPYCSSQPSVLKDIHIPDEIHQKNVKSIEEMAQESSIVVYAWGTKGPDQNQMPPQWLKNIVGPYAWCINLSKNGVPKHPNQWGPHVTPVPSVPTMFSKA